MAMSTKKATKKIAKKGAPLPTKPKLPISKSAAKTAAKWLVDNFDHELSATVDGKIYKKKHLCAIACQETAYKWLDWIQSQNAKAIVERCVFDASGDAP